MNKTKDTKKLTFLSIMLALTIFFSYDLFINENSKKIYFLPLVTLFWANFHGGSSNLSYIFCIIFLSDTKIVKQLCYSWFAY